MTDPDDVAYGIAGVGVIIGISGALLAVSAPHIPPLTLVELGAASASFGLLLFAVGGILGYRLEDDGTAPDAPGAKSVPLEEFDDR